YTQGNWTTDHRRLEEVGPIVSARVVHPNDQITIMTSNGIVLRTAVHGISSMGRATRGVRIVNLQGDDSVAALAVITYDDLTRGVDGGTEDETAIVETGVVNGHNGTDGSDIVSEDTDYIADDIEDEGAEDEGAEDDDTAVEEAETA
ncbi:MAG: hypothetical protein KDE53_38095, partial [Caldilineaceae bacterium]|nr:hypothetical protein [Caldilineaceae bacterium]